MSTQAKNKFLAYLVIAMLAVVAILASGDDEPKTVAVVLPKAIPEVVVIERDTTERKADMIATAEFECMRKNVYFEAGNQDIKGKELVALVTLNRTKTKSFPSTVCGVVRQTAQFSWYWDGKSDRPNLNNVLERRAWDDATRVATAAMRGRVRDFTNGATHYHATYVNPGWARSSRMKRIAQVGLHIIYRDIKLKAKA